jgi:hypothetical protein
MAITFEQKQDISKSLIAAAIIVVLLAAIGFFVWKIYWQPPVEVETADTTQIQLEYRILNDDRIVSMELYPQIPAADEASVGKKNPFSEIDASSTEELENNGGAVMLQPAGQPAGQSPTKR